MVTAEGSEPPKREPFADDYLRCARQRIDDPLSQGRLRRFKDGSRTLVARAELDRYLNRRA